MSRGNGKLGLKEVIAMGVGGMVSGGIYAVLGVAMQQSGDGVLISYAIAGIITLLTGYSYVKLTLHFGERGGTFSFVEHTVENEKVAGYVGWVLLLGYVGVMAMYAFAFGAYSLTALEEIAGFTAPGWVRPGLSTLVVATFVGLNIAGVEETGLVEDIAVYIKIVILLSLATLGIVFFDGDYSSLNIFEEGYLSPIVGFAIIFVSYEGFQLLVYDYEEIEDVETNLPRGMYLAIGITILIYISVSLMASLQLTPEQLIQHKETALAKAVSNIPFLGGVGFTLVILSAIKSTSSGINATLFGTARLAHKIAAEGKLPRLFSFRNREGIPVYALVIIGLLTALFASFGSLKQITEFGSVAFLIADAVTNWVGFRLRDDIDASAWIPLAGLIGTAVALPVVVWHLYETDIGILISIGAIFAIIAIVEFGYMERQTLEESLEELAAEALGEEPEFLVDEDEDADSSGEAT